MRPARFIPAVLSAALAIATFSVTGFAAEPGIEQLQQVDLIGVIAAIDAPSRSLIVSGLTVTTDDQTTILMEGNRITLADLSPGEFVEVKGTPQPDHSVLAQQIEVLPAPAPEVELEGVVQSVTPPDLIVSGLIVTTDASTRFEGLAQSFADLKVGDFVQVEGTPQADGSVQAAAVIDLVPPSPPEPQVDLKGVVQSIQRSFLVVSGLTVTTDGQTTILQEGNTITLADLSTGEFVEVEGTPQPDHSVLAQQIEVLPAPAPEVELEGVVQSVTPPDLIVSGLIVTTDASTRFEGLAQSFADLKVGDFVQVEGTPQVDGSVQAVVVIDFGPPLPPQ